MSELAVLCGFAFTAGCVDAVAGGGGLIQLPALFIMLPDAPVVTVLAVNKCAASSGTLFATLRYLRSVRVAWRATLPAAGAAAVCSFLGARTVALLDPAFLRPLMLVLLAGAALYTFLHKDFGLLHAPRLRHVAQVLWGSAAGMLIGFYDGFFGPGTGTFLMLVFVALFGFDFLHAAASTKIVNVTTNLAALVFFVWHGHVEWRWALPMAVANIAGGMLGAHLAVLRGSRFMRKLVLVMVCAVIARYAYDIVMVWWKR